MVNCMVLCCENKGRIPGLRYFHLTKARHDVWMRALRRDPTVEHLSEHNVICSKHFLPEDLNFKLTRMYPKPNAVPRLFLCRNEGISESSQYPDVNEGCKMVDVKIEDVDIIEQFIDDNGVHNREDLVMESSKQEVSGDTRFHKCESSEYGASSKESSDKHFDNAHLKHEQYEINLNASSANVTLKECIDVKKHKCSSCEYNTNDIQHLTNHKVSVHVNLKQHECNSSDYEVGEGCQMNDVKIEDVEIVEQFIDENGVDSRGEFMVKSESDGLSQQAHRDLVIESDHEIGEFNSKQEVSGDTRIHKCESCEYGANSRESLDKHCDNAHLKQEDLNASTDNDTPKQCIDGEEHKCSLCEYNTNDLQHFEEHIVSVHSNLKQHKCDLCEYNSSLKSDLEEHVDDVHLNWKEHMCHLCDFASNRKNMLKSHIESVHLNLKEHKCHMCDFASNWKGQLKIHINSVHLNLKEHTCNNCGYTANTRFYLRKHIDTVHLNKKQYKCSLCDYIANYKTNLKYHIESVHLNLKKYKCDLCDYAAIQKKYLKIHIATVHLNVREHKCNYCDYATNMKHHLKRHVDSRHLNLKQYGSCLIVFSQ